MNAREWTSGLNGSSYWLYRVTVFPVHRQGLAMFGHSHEDSPASVWETSKLIKCSVPVSALLPLR